MARLFIFRGAVNTRAVVGPACREQCWPSTCGEQHQVSALSISRTCPGLTRNPSCLLCPPPYQAGGGGGNNLVGPRNLPLERAPGWAPVPSCTRILQEPPLLLEASWAGRDVRASPEPSAQLRAGCDLQGPESWPLEGRGTGPQEGPAAAPTIRGPAGRAHGGGPCRHPDRSKAGLPGAAAGPELSRSREQRAGLLRVEERALPGAEPPRAPMTSQS